VRTFNAMDSSGASGNRNILKGITLYHNVLDAATETQVKFDNMVAHICASINGQNYPQIVNVHP
jgi:hypothetical protein